MAAPSPEYWRFPRQAEVEGRVCLPVGGVVKVCAGTGKGDIKVTCKTPLPGAGECPSVLWQAVVCAVAWAGEKVQAMAGLWSAHVAAGLKRV